MVCELCCHRRGSMLPFAPQRGLWNGDAQRLMRAYEIEDHILKGEMAPQEIALLRMRQRFTHQAPDTLARGEIVTLDISCIDLLATKHLGDDVARTAVSVHGLEVAPVALRQRAAYVHALTAGQTAQEYEPKGKADQDMAKLYRWLRRTLQASS